MPIVGDPVTLPPDGDTIVIPYGDPQYVCEVARAQIEQTGKWLDCFTGQVLTRDDLNRYDEQRSRQS